MSDQPRVDVGFEGGGEGVDGPTVRGVACGVAGVLLRVRVFRLAGDVLVGCYRIAAHTGSQPPANQASATVDAW